MYMTEMIYECSITSILLFPTISSPTISHVFVVPPRIRTFTLHEMPLHAQERLLGEPESHVDDTRGGEDVAEGARRIDVHNISRVVTISSQHNCSRSVVESRSTNRKTLAMTWRPNRLIRVWSPGAIVWANAAVRANPGNYTKRNDR